MIEKEIDVFEKVQTQLEGMYNEISLLSKKSQNDAVSTFKMKFINKILVNTNSVLGEEYKPFDDFDLFNVDEIPTNSDVVMILSQYLNCFEKLRADNVSLKGVWWYWVIDNETTDIKTRAPRKIREK